MEIWISPIFAEKTSEATQPKPDMQRSPSLKRSGSKRGKAIRQTTYRVLDGLLKSFEEFDLTLPSKYPDFPPVDSPDVPSTASAGVDGVARVLGENPAISGALSKLFQDEGDSRSWKDVFVVLAQDATLFVFKSNEPHNTPITTMSIKSCNGIYDQFFGSWMLQVAGDLMGPDGVPVYKEWTFKCIDQPDMKMWVDAFNRIARVGANREAATRAGVPLAVTTRSTERPFLQPRNLSEQSLQTPTMERGGPRSPVDSPISSRSPPVSPRPRTNAIKIPSANGRMQGMYEDGDQYSPTLSFRQAAPQTRSPTNGFAAPFAANPNQKGGLARQLKSGEAPVAAYVKKKVGFNL
ncbi:hypothetical protein HDU98_011564 [Podochytrium sp. JEL0797]|nr:hypothetical protein HDU98_011564 [Podochytrium sp. JEL0797]